MRKLSENEIKQISGGDGNDGQAELIAIGSLAGTFISPGFGSIAGAYIGDKVHSWATTATVREGANKWGNSSRLTQSFHFFMFEPIFSPVNAL
uniref:colicin V family bacteriocin n=1 Tax=Escherichia coli TaxID=562 RepID=UPI002020E4DE